MERVLRTSPITVAFMVYQSFVEFDFSQGAVYECAYDHVDRSHLEDTFLGGHAVELVGFTNDHWILKNSWGPGWGDNGYFYMRKGVNTCGIETYHTFYPKPMAYHGADRNTEPTEYELKAAVAIARRHTGVSGLPMELDDIIEAKTTLVAGQRLRMVLRLRDPVDGATETREVDVVIPPALFVVNSRQRRASSNEFDEMLEVVSDNRSNEFDEMLEVISDEQL